MNRETFAAIDIGSNAIRLLISYVERSSYSAQFKKAAFVRVPIRLGEDVFTIGEIGTEKLQKMTEAMTSFAYLMKTFNVRGYRACATSAMREAKNGSQVVEQILEESGINIEIISGKEEAETIFEAGDIGGFMNSDKSYLYVDVGGGSTEVTIYNNRKRVKSESFPLGTVRMLSGAVSADDMKNFKDWLKNVAEPHKPVAIIGSGGNINKVHKLLYKKDKEPMHYVEVKLLYDQLKDLSYEERIKNLGLNVYRADVIMPALKIFLTVGKMCKINEIIVPKIGLADGIIHQLSSESNR